MKGLCVCVWVGGCGCGCGCVDVLDYDLKACSRSGLERRRKVALNEDWRLAYLLAGLLAALIAKFKVRVGQKALALAVSLRRFTDSL